MTDFPNLPSFLRLKKLSERPIDLSDSNVLTPGRIDRMRASALGFQLFFGTERVTDEVMEALYALAEESLVLEKMKAMQQGEILNKIEGFESENRPVLHTAMRDLFDHPQQSERAKAAALKAKEELEKLTRFLHDVPFTDLVQIGIGGSDLGPRALYMALLPFRLRGRRVHFLSNVDPDDASRVLTEIPLEKTLVVVVSKSGSTLETLTNEEFLRRRFEKLGLDPKKHFVAVTGEKSPMDDPSRYLSSFYMWDYVGGRYSATSMVGAVSLSFAYGIDAFKEILQGAHAMDRVSLHPTAKTNLPLLSALLGVWNRNFLHHSNVAVIPYSQALLRFPAHLQQLDMESNGKRINQRGEAVKFDTGPILWGEPGTNGQHSFYQMLHQGTTVVPIEFIGFLKSQYLTDVEIQGTLSQEKLLSNLFAQSIAFAVGQVNANPNKFFPGNRPNRILLAERLDPFTLGALLSFYENKVAFQGFLWGINSFDQEGVQLGKRLAKKMIRLFGAKRAKSPLESFPLGEAFLKYTQSD